MADFTAGPWEHRFETPGGMIEWSDIYQVGADKQICQMRRHNPNHLADARLIAAAPELLEALKLCLAAAKGCDCISGSKYPCGYHEIRRIAAATISKAVQL